MYSVWRKTLLVAMLVCLVGLNLAFSNDDQNSTSPVYYEARARSPEGIQIHYANKSELVNGTRQSDQIMILGNSRITIPKDKANWPGVKIVTGDSYLKALEYSQNIRNAHDGGVEINSKSTQLIRREFNPSPIYKPDQERNIRTAGGQLDPRVLYQGANQNAFTRDDFTPPIQPAADFNAASASASASASATAGGFTPVQVDNVFDTYGLPPAAPPSGPYDYPAQPQDVYGPPPMYEDSYKPMQNSGYGYPQQAYGPPQNTGSPYSFDMFSSMGLTWPFIKLNAVTVAKILLKVIIFKLIVKFIGIVCLLLFIPKLKKEEADETDNEERSLKSLDNYQYLDEITSRVFSAWENFEKYMQQEESQLKKDESCSTVWCLIQKSFAVEQNDSPATTKTKRN